jgi:hypothetical protein
MPIYGWVAVGILITGLVVLLFGGNDGVLLGVDPGQLAAVTAMLAFWFILAAAFSPAANRSHRCCATFWSGAGARAAAGAGYWIYQSTFSR